MFDNIEVSLLYQIVTVNVYLYAQISKDFKNY